MLGKKIIPPAKDRNPLSKKNYAGGYLFCPKAGIYNYVFDEDLTSLYPSIIMTVNIGKETMVGSIIDADDRNNRLGLNDLKLRDYAEELIVSQSRSVASITPLADIDSSFCSIIEINLPILTLVLLLLLFSTINSSA